MRKEIIEKEIYNIEDVKNNEDLREKILEKYRTINVNYEGWHDYMIEDFKSELENLGYSDVVVSYEGFWSQGDGASFIGLLSFNEDVFKRLYPEWNNLRPSIKDIIMDNFDEAKIVRNSWLHYVHSGTIESQLNTYRIDNTVYYHTRIEKKVNEVLNTIKENLDIEIKRLSDDLYDRLRDEYYHLIEDEQVLETLEINEYEFTEDGEIY